MAATVTVTDALNTSLGEHIAGDENPLNALGIVKVEFVSMAARTTPLPSRSSTPPVIQQTYANPTRTEIHQVAGVVTIDFADPSTNAYADIDLIAVWFQRKTDPNTFTGNPFIGLFVSEIAVDTNSNPIYLGVDKISTAEVSWALVLEFSGNEISNISFIVQNPQSATNAEMEAATLTTKYAGPGQVKHAIDYFANPVTETPITGTNNDYDLDTYTTPGDFLLSHSGATNWANEPANVGQTDVLRLSVQSLGNSNVQQRLTAQSNASDPDSVDAAKPWWRRSYNGGTEWSDWHLDTALSSTELTTLIQQTINKYGGGGNTVQLALQTTTDAPWDGGTTDPLNSLVKPHKGQWLNASDAELHSFGVMEGISLVTGGIHFDWTDTAIASAKVRFEVSGGGNQGVSLAGVNGQRVGEDEFGFGGAFIGVTVNGLDVMDDKLYALDSNRNLRVFRLSDGSRITAEDLTLASVAAAPRGLAISSAKVYAVVGDYIRVWNFSDGSRISAEDISITVSGSWKGLTIHDGKVYVVGGVKMAVYNLATKTRVAADEFSLDTENTTAEDISIFKDKFYVLDSADDKVYAYGQDGTRLPNEDFDVTGTWERTLAVANNRAYLAVENSSGVRVYQVGSVPRFGIVKTSGGITASDMASLAINDTAATWIRSGVVTVTRNDYLLMAAEATMTPFYLTGTVLGTTAA